MTLLQAAILGIVQGITEFLPVSSDGHLVLVQHLLGIQEPPIFFDIILHLATLIAIICFFWSQLIKINQTQIKYLLITTIPTGIIGLILNHYLESLYASLYATAAGFLVTTIFLLLARSRHAATSSLTYKKAFLIGIMQGIAVLPGVSRSGTTVSTGLLLGLSSTQAFTFSFVAAIPAILGAQVVGLSKFTTGTQFPLSVYVLGCVCAGITGFFSLVLLKRIMANHYLHRFALYTFVIAVVTVLVAQVSN